HVLLCRPPHSRLFPYTTLFRSVSPVVILPVTALTWFAILRRVAIGTVHLIAHIVRTEQAEIMQRLHRRYVGRAAGHCRSHARPRDRKSTRLNSSHVAISYAVFC